MGASDWREILGASQFLGGLYGGQPPTLNECELFYVHADERDKSMTLGFETRKLPSHPDPEWQKQAYNRFEFYLLFSGVADLQVGGWGMREAREVDIAGESGGVVRVSMGRMASGVHFTASSTRLASTRVYLASDAP